ncbi:hypothetical protein PRUB_a0104 [Pseudoalteromonas rubra]|uniref:Uncharacterized protein n=1 Tax=Pseudoalteromonas rubra TaxID=43658 RepID=A0A8T0C6R6_9GAMM|nr:hypothetical protein [Pseudoalteromonas rubra]KAF7785732.1 hypothetical protein PRUB_a0104 [Pseudoalteromonas rubra]
MYVPVEKLKENKSRAIAKTTACTKSNDKQSFVFLDNRPEAITQRKVQPLANLSSSLPIQKKDNNTGLHNNLKDFNSNHVSTMQLRAVTLVEDADRAGELGVREIRNITMVGRPPGIWSNTMGAHTTAYQMYKDALRRSLINLTLPEAVQTLHNNVIAHEAVYMGRLRNDGVGSPREKYNAERQLYNNIHALAIQVGGATTARIGKMIEHYLNLNELLAGTAYNTGPGANPGRGEASYAKALRAIDARMQGGEAAPANLRQVVQAAVTGLYDRVMDLAPDNKIQGNTSAAVGQTAMNIRSDAGQRFTNTFEAAYPRVAEAATILGFGPDQRLEYARTHAREDVVWGAGMGTIDQQRDAITLRYGEQGNRQDTFEIDFDQNAQRKITRLEFEGRPEVPFQDNSEGQHTTAWVVIRNWMTTQLMDKNVNSGLTRLKRFMNTFLDDVTVQGLWNVGDVTDGYAHDKDQASWNAERDAITARIAEIKTRPELKNWEIGGREILLRVLNLYARTPFSAVQSQGKAGGEAEYVHWLINNKTSKGKKLESGDLEYAAIRLYDFRAGDNARQQQEGGPEEKKLLHRHLKFIQEAFPTNGNSIKFNKLQKAMEERKEEID